MIHMSLFSGIGGFELAAEWMGWDNLVSCEINDFGRKVLEYYWPNGYHHDDIHTLTYDKINEELTRRYGADWRSDDIILTGGFPCQPYSAAGKRLGKEDDRHLWPQMCRIIREVRPKWVVGENVLGLVNWNDGMVFDEVQADLEAEGYEVQPYVLPAAGVGAPHRRDRVWFVAYSKRSRTWSDNGAIGNEGRRASKDRSESIRQAHGEVGSSRIDATSENGITPDTRNESRGSEQRCKDKPERELLSKEQQGSTIRPTFARCSGIGSTSDTDRDGHDEQSKTGNNAKRKNNKQSGTQRISTVKRPCNEWNASDTNLRKQRADWRDFPTQPPVRSRNDGLSSELVGITVSKHRNESIKAYGNAICPQVAHLIFKAIQQYKDQQS
jgi:DNA (cytosine-5)-methyltransferase 1